VDLLGVCQLTDGFRIDLVFRPALTHILDEASMPIPSPLDHTLSGREAMMMLVWMAPSRR
jgi:hypothetical protein